MRNKLLRRAAVLTAALFSLTCMSVTAYAQSHEPVEETTPPAAEETTAKPFTPDGTGTVVDNATDEDGKFLRERHRSRHGLPRFQPGPRRLCSSDTYPCPPAHHRYRQHPVP